jgi:hypothetical protein
MAKVSLDRYLAAVKAKLQKPNTRKLLMFGKLDSRYSQGLRDEVGYLSTCNNIMQSAENVWNCTNGCDAVAERIANFADMPGYSDVSKVQTIGAVDVTVFALANSLIPFLCVDRGMSTPVDTIYYSDIVARNSAGGVQAGDKVLGNFNPPNADLDLGIQNKKNESTNSTGAAATVEVSGIAQAIPGQIQVTITDGSNTYVGQDFGANGTVYFSNYAGGVTVDYATGKVVAANVPAGATVSVDYASDFTKDQDGADVLHVAQDWVPVQLETGAKEIILDANLLNNAFMNKTYKFSGGSAAKDYADLAFNRMTDVYVEAMNIEVLRTLTGAKDIAVKAYHNANAVPLDLSSYDISKFAQTKNDMVAQFIISMKASFLARTNIAPTVIVTGTAGSSLLEGHNDKFVANPAAAKGLNGLVGYFDGLPVYRHNYLDKITPAGQADFYMANKFADNSCGTMAFGEYLPLTHTGNISNFRQPIHVANGFFSMVGSKLIEKALVQKGTVTLPEVMRVVR